MTRSHGRCPKGERLRMGFPHGHRKTTTLVEAPTTVSTIKLTSDAPADFPRSWELQVWQRPRALRA